MKKCQFKEFNLNKRLLIAIISCLGSFWAAETKGAMAQEINSSASLASKNSLGQPPREQSLEVAQASPVEKEHPSVLLEPQESATVESSANLLLSPEKAADSQQYMLLDGFSLQVPPKTQGKGDLPSVLLKNELPEIAQNQPESIPSESPTAIPATAQEPIFIKKIEIDGSTVFGKAQFDPITQPLEGKTVTRQDLLGAVRGITQLYLNGGYLNSRAVLADVGADGVVKIQVIEGTISPENIKIEGATRLENYVRERILLGIAKPLNVKALEEQLRLLKINPLFENVEASLRPPEKKPGQETSGNESELVIRITEANPFYGNVSIDNYSPPSVGATRLSVNLADRNLTGLGDELFVSYRPRLEAFTDTYRVEFGYQVPLNPKNGTLAVRGLIDENKVVEGPFEPFDIRGSSERYEINYRQPLVLSPREELAISFGFQYYQGQTFTFAGPTPFGSGPNADGYTSTSVFTFGQDYTFRDTSGAWALRSQFRIGANILGATDNPSPIPSGQFFSWLAQVQRVQVIAPNNLLIVQFDSQLSPNSLLASEQFVIGGGQSVRGYRQNVLAGDNGLRFSIEDRITVARNELEDPVFTIAPFFDCGAVWNAPGDPNIIIANSNFIAGLGLGLIWQPVKGLNLRLDYAPPLVDLNIRGNNIQDDGFYFSLSYDF